MQRQSKELGLDAGSPPGVESYRGGTYRPQQAQIKPDVAGQALAGLLSLGESAAAQQFGQSAQEAYLQGGIAAAQGESAQDVVTNPVMRPFAYGGFHDEDYRIKQTEAVNKFDNWLKTEGMRYDPTDPRVTEMLNKTSAEAMSAITPGMTGRARAEALLSQSQTNRSLVTKHNKAYTDWSIKEAARRIVPQGNQIADGLVKAMQDDDSATYTALADKAALYFTDLNNNPTIPEDMRQEMSKNFLLSLANTDQRLPIENMRDAGLLDSMPFERREQIDNALRESKNRTEVRDLGRRIEYNAKFEQAAAAGEKSSAEINQYIQEGYNDGWMTTSHAMSLFDKAATGAANKQLTRDQLSALVRGDFIGLQMLGSDVPTAMQALDDQMKKGGSTSGERLNTMVGMGLKYGSIPKSYGELVGQAVRAIGQTKPGEATSPEFEATLNTVASLVTVANKTSPYKSQVLLGALPDDTRGAMSYVLGQAEFGVQPADALRTYWTKNEQVKNMQDAERQRYNETWKKKYSVAINKEFPRSFYDNFFAGVLGQDQKIKDDQFSNTMILSNVWEEMRFQSQQEYNLGMDEASLVASAASKVRERTIPTTEHGNLTQAYPLVLGRDVDIDSTFGTRDTRLIGQVLANAYPPAKDGLTSVFVWDSTNKQIINQQLDESGQIVDRVTVPSDKIKRTVTDRQNAKVDAAKAEQFGRLYTVGDTLLNIDGRNSAGVSPQVAYGARELILKASPENAEAILSPAAGLVANRQTQVPSEVFRNATDLALARAVRHVGPAYKSKQAQIAIAAGVSIEGADVMEKVIAEASRALDEGNPEKLQKALSRVSNPTIQAELLKALPNGRAEQKVFGPGSVGFSTF